MARQEEATSPESEIEEASSPRGEKRDRSDDEEEEEMRRVVQRTDDDEDVNGLAIDITECVRTIGRSNDEKVLYSTMEQIENSLANESRRIENQKVFLRVGGPITVVLALEKYHECEYLQEVGLSVLASASCDDEELRAVIAEVGGIQAIVAAMKRFSLTYKIQWLGISALANLIRYAPNAKVLALETDGVIHVIRAMNEFSDAIVPGSGSPTTDIVGPGCYVIFRLSQIDDLKKPMRDANVVTTLARLIDGYKEVESMQELACKAMESLVKV